MSFAPLVLLTALLGPAQGSSQGWERALLSSDQPPSHVSAVNLAFAATELETLDESDGTLEIRFDIQLGWEDTRILEGLEKNFQHECRPRPKNPCVCKANWDMYSCSNQTGCPATACDGYSGGTWCEVENPGCDEDASNSGYFFCARPVCECAREWEYQPVCKGVNRGCPILLCDEETDPWCYVTGGGTCGSWKWCEPDQCDDAGWTAFKTKNMVHGKSATFKLETTNLIKRLLTNVSSSMGSVSGLWSPMPSYLEVNAYYRSSAEGLFTSDITDEQTHSFPMENAYASYPFDRHELQWCIKFDQDLDLRVHPSPFSEDFVRRPLASLTRRTREPFVESDLSPHLGKRVIDMLSDKGFSVDSVETSVSMASHYPKACLNVKVSRRYQVVIFRLFAPMLLLVSTPVVGFFLPVRATMPRIATGFISFLSLQVFVTRGYAMLPRSSSTLVFIDLLMLTVTEMLYLAVLENIVAIRLDAVVSHFAAEHLDNLSRSGFPLTMLCVLSAVFAMGVLEADKVFMLLILHTIIVFFPLAIFCKMRLYMRRLPQHIIQVLINDINTGKMLWSDSATIDARELSRVFRFIDKDESGFINGDELIAVFRRFGLDLPDNQLDELKALFHQECGENVDFVTFQSHFKKVFCSKLTHHVKLSRAQTADV